jgi:CRP/FNR family nitrogen fixation transcriptional regulator
MNRIVARIDHRKNSRSNSNLRSSNASPTLLRDCSQQTVKSGILALRRGPIRYRRDAMIVSEGDRADYIFLVAKGVVRSCRTYHDGSRGIVAFHFPGELFGWSDGSIHLISAEAVTDTLILFFKRNALLSAAVRDTKIASYLLDAATNDLRHGQEHSLLLGRLATCRVATFLMDLSTKMGNPKYLKLPMTLLDIADHLGLKMETVSRTIAALEKSGSIARTSYRTLLLRNRASLARITNQSLLFSLNGYFASFGQW